MYATDWLKPYDPRQPPAAYRYGMFGYFLLMEEDWHQLRLRMGSIWTTCRASTRQQRHATHGQHGACDFDQEDPFAKGQSDTGISNTGTMDIKVAAVAAARAGWRAVPRRRRETARAARPSTRSTKPVAASGAAAPLQRSCSARLLDRFDRARHGLPGGHSTTRKPSRPANTRTCVAAKLSIPMAPRLPSKSPPAWPPIPEGHQNARWYDESEPARRSHPSTCSVCRRQRWRFQPQ